MIDGPHGALSEAGSAAGGIAGMLRAASTLAGADAVAPRALSLLAGVLDAFPARPGPVADTMPAAGFRGAICYTACLLARSCKSSDFLKSYQADLVCFLSLSD